MFPKLVFTANELNWPCCPLGGRGGKKKTDSTDRKTKR
uniref:Uncharacterized protein n=1 Tax=Rhizophora mucronata TaxID=61149 RepID=A0A2P2NZB0_RHIMU